MALILHMPMQDDAANATVDDISASNNDGTLTSGTTADFSVEGPGGNLPKALDVAATATAVLDSPIGPLENLTIEFWAKRTNTLETDGIAGSGGASFVGFDIGEHSVIFQDGGEVQDTLDSGVDTTQWHHFGITYTSSTGAVNLYVDGELADSGSVSDAGLNIARIWDGDVGVPLNGPLAGVRVYDEVRTQQQIQADMEADVPSGGGGSINPVLRRSSIGLGLNFGFGI